MRSISGLFVYPVKSFHGTALTEAALGPRGLRYDREWMLVDAYGQFITQRDKPELARIVPTVDANALRLSAPTLADISVPSVEWNGGKRLSVRVWNNTCEAVDQGPEVNAWLSQFCGADVRLVRMAESFVRPSRRQSPGGAVAVGFADGYPLLLISEESLLALNAVLASPVPMSRFRPNIVVSGCDKPYEEDEWNHFTIAGVGFQGAKPCGRCVITTFDQDDGRRTGKEPLATLAKIRREGKEALFGMNLNHQGEGVLRVGDVVKGIVFGARPAA